MPFEMDIESFEEARAAHGQEKRSYPDLEAYIARHYVDPERLQNRFMGMAGAAPRNAAGGGFLSFFRDSEKKVARKGATHAKTDMAQMRREDAPKLPPDMKRCEDAPKLPLDMERCEDAPKLPPDMELCEDAPTYASAASATEACDEVTAEFDFEKHESALNERMTHLSDTYQEYLLYLIENKGMTNAEVYKRAIVDKKVFAKIKANPDYHPKKMTALCLCVGAKLNLDETRDLLARAGYALSPCDKTDVIFSYFIENGIYDMIEIDIQLEEHGLPCIIA